MAKTAFYTFVQTVYNKLYKIESRVNGGKSPLSVFCRFDIGLIENSNQEVCSSFNNLNITPHISTA